MDLADAGSARLVDIDITSFVRLRLSPIHLLSYIDLAHRVEAGSVGDMHSGMQSSTRDDVDFATVLTDVSDYGLVAVEAVLENPLGNAVFKSPKHHALTVASSLG
jgi:hypothetical protein